MPEFSVSNRTLEPLLKAERSYEEFFIGTGTVLQIGKKWHMWYTSADRGYRGNGDRYLCYASSEDGLTWVRPDLGLFEYKGSRKNNILFYGPKVVKGGIGSASVFVDQDAPKNERFKMVFDSEFRGKWLVFNATSPDGLKWKLGSKPIMNQNADTQNICIQDGDLYRLYVRMWSKGNYEGHRLIGYCESRNFESFPNPAVILQPEKDDPKDLHLYGPGASKLGNGKYVMLIPGYHTKEDVVRVYLAFSRDGKNFKRVGRNPIVDLGKSFDSKGLYIMPGAIPADKPGTHWVYYMGTGTPHEEYRMDNRIRYAGGIGRFLLEVKDASVGAEADLKE